MFVLSEPFNQSKTTTKHTKTKQKQQTKNKTEQKTHKNPTPVYFLYMQ
jgi:hypothetical protein